jgi:hypothetical protein
MGRNQGVIRLKQGIVRNLTPHELARGYLYISQDKHLREILDVDDFEVAMGGEVCSRRAIDSYGRVQIPVRLLRDIGTARKADIVLVSRKRLNIAVANLGSKRQGGSGTART